MYVSVTGSKSSTVDSPTRVGVIEDVVHGDPSPRYRICWDDGHETMYTPAAGSLHKLATENEAT